MSKPRYLRAIRCSLVARLLAASVVVLGVTPFTAPFAVYDLADLTAPSNVPDSLSSVKDLKDADAVAIVIVPGDARVELLPLAQAVVDATGPPFVRALVLRI
jgi:hypothetical protein